MELFQNAKTVRLRSHHDKFLLADSDRDSVCQDRQGGAQRARWTIEYAKSGDGVGLVRLKSCFDKYLTATDEQFLLGVTGKKVKQTVPRRLDSSIEWEPIRDGVQVKLKTRYGNFLRANGGVPPWRNSITHDVPSRSHTQDWVLWKVNVLQFYPQTKEEQKNELEDQEDEPFSFGVSKLESAESCSAPPAKNEGRLIRYNVIDDEGNIVEGELKSFHFLGHGVEELNKKLAEETRLEEVTVCSRNPLNGTLYPLRLALPPNNVKMHVFVVPASSKVAKELEGAIP